MPILIIHKKHNHEGGQDLFEPHVICDYCQEPIKENGNVEYMVASLDISDGYMFQLAFTHKECCWRFEEEHGGRALWRTEELNVFLGDLMHNFGFNKERYNDHRKHQI